MDIELRPDKQKRLLRSATVAALVVAIAGLFALAWFMASRPPAVDEDRIWTTTVKRAELVREISAAGTLVAPELRAVTNRSEGVVERVLRLPGDRVTADDVLLEMSGPQIEQELVSARWELTAAEAEEALQRVEADNRKLDLIAQVAGAESEFTSARLELEAQEELGEGAIFSAIEVKRTRLRVDQLKRRMEAEQARLDRYPEYLSAQREASQARLSRLREHVRQLEKRVDDLRVRAGTDGVVREINVEEGERLDTGQAVARVVNPDHLIARVRVAERDAAGVSEGMPVELEIGRERIDGEVMRIDPTVRERAVNVDVRLVSDKLPSLRPDLSVTARIELERVDDALVMDRPLAVRGENESISLFRLSASGDRAERVPVEIGRTSQRQVEVLHGLQAGDRVILSDLSDWQEQSVVRIR